MIRGIDFVTIEVYGLLQSYNATIEDCQILVEHIESLKKYEVKVLAHRQDSAFIDVALYPKNGNKEKFIKDLKDDGLAE